MQKQTPKSCGCSQCKRGKSSTAGKILMKLDERKHRHKQNQKLRNLEEDIQIVPIGNYYD